MDLIKIAKPLFGIALALLFVSLGCYLIQKEDTMSQVIGYANVIFFSALLILALFKIIKTVAKKP